MTNYVRGGTVVEGPIGALEPMVENEPTPHQSGSVPTTLGVATVLTAVSAVTTWFRVHALDTDKWVTANSELREDPEIRSALATQLVGELHSGPDVSDQPEASFADALGRLAGPLAGARRGPASRVSERVLERPLLEEARTEANRRTRAAPVATVRDDTVERLDPPGARWCSTSAAPCMPSERIWGSPLLPSTGSRTTSDG